MFQGQVAFWVSLWLNISLWLIQPSKYDSNQAWETRAFWECQFWKTDLFFKNFLVLGGWNDDMLAHKASFPISVVLRPHVPNSECCFSAST